MGSDDLLMKKVTIHTDGACKGNPGPGGYGAVLVFGPHRKEIQAGFRHTTNNRMELRAAIAALEELREPCEVELYSDSKYLVKAINERWIQGWQRNGWTTAARQPVKNQDLWQRLALAMERHRIHWRWLKGHAGHAENERCDELANEVIRSGPLKQDEGFSA